MATRKKAGKTVGGESKYYIAKTVSDAKEKIEDKVNTYNDKYVKTPLEKGRKFVTELKDAPTKKIDGLLNDGKKALKKAKSTRVSAIRKKVDTTKKDVRRKFKAINRNTRKVYRGIEGDAKLLVEDVKSMGKKKVDKLSLQKTIKKRIDAGKKRIDAGIEEIPQKLNLPSKSDIDQLLAGLEGANQKVDDLSRQVVSA